MWFWPNSTCTITFTRHNACVEENPSLGPVLFIVQSVILRDMWQFRKKTRNARVSIGDVIIPSELFPPDFPSELLDVAFTAHNEAA
jgi:hypothetical protein